jgi:uncharacterized RmlC-like cupin family protein
MRMRRIDMRRSLVLLGVLGVGLAGVWAQAAQQPAAAPPAQTFNPANFNPGARTKWHSHEGGQVLFAETGRLRVQEKGKPAQELAQGATLHVPAGVPHWHGALPDAGITQISLSFGTTTWMDPVSDSDYKR